MSLADIDDSTAGDDYYRRFKSGEMFNQEKETSISADSGAQDRRDAPSSVTKPDKAQVTKPLSPFVERSNKRNEPSRHQQQQPASSSAGTRASITESKVASATEAPVSTKHTPVSRSSNPLPQSLPSPCGVAPFERLVNDGRPVAQTACVMSLTLACTARRTTTRSSTGVGGGSPAMRAVADAQASRPSLQELDRVLPPFAVLCQHLLPLPRTPEDVLKDFLTCMDNTVVDEGDAFTSPGGLRIMKRKDPSRLIINDSFVLVNHFTYRFPKSETDVSIAVNGTVLYQSISWAVFKATDLLKCNKLPNKLAYASDHGDYERGSKDAARNALEPLAKQEGLPLKDFLSAVGLYGLL